MEPQHRHVFAIPGVAEFHRILFDYQFLEDEQKREMWDKMVGLCEDLLRSGRHIDVDTFSDMIFGEEFCDEHAEFDHYDFHVILGRYLRGGEEFNVDPTKESAAFAVPGAEAFFNTLRASTCIGDDEKWDLWNMTSLMCMDLVSSTRNTPLMRLDDNTLFLQKMRELLDMTDDVDREPYELVWCEFFMNCRAPASSRLT